MSTSTSTGRRGGLRRWLLAHSESEELKQVVREELAVLDLALSGILEV